MGLISVYSSKNVGVRAISSALSKAGIKVDTIFFKELIASDSPFPTEKEYDLLIGLLKDLKVNIAGLSIICSSCESIAVRITNRIHKELGIPVVWGTIAVLMHRWSETNRAESAIARTRRPPVSGIDEECQSSNDADQ